MVVTSKTDLQTDFRLPNNGLDWESRSHIGLNRQRAYSCFVFKGSFSMGENEIDYNCIYFMALSSCIHVWDVKDCVDED